MNSRDVTIVCSQLKGPKKFKFNPSPVRSDCVYLLAVSNVSYEIVHTNVRPNQLHGDRRSATDNATDAVGAGVADDQAATAEDEDSDDGAATVEDDDADDGAATVEDEDEAAATVDDDDGAAIVSDEDGGDGVEAVTVVGAADGDGGDDGGRDALERRPPGEAKNAVLAYLTGARRRLYDKIRTYPLTQVDRLLFFVFGYFVKIPEHPAHSILCDDVENYGKYRVRQLPYLKTNTTNGIGYMGLFLFFTSSRDI